MHIDTLESRLHYSASLGLSTSKMLFSGPKGKTTAAQWVTITNNGDAPLKIKSGGISLVGNDSSKFALSSVPTLATGLAPGAKVAFKVVFKPTTAGVKSTTLTIKSNDPAAPIAGVALRGLGADGLYDAKEPSLQRIFNLHQIPISAGDADFTTSKIDNLIASSAIDMQTLTKASEGPVTFEMLAAYSGVSDPGGRFGWYAPGHTQDLDGLKELFTIPAADVQRINPRAMGTTSFDPGESEFALYSSWPTQSYDKVFSENALNTWEANELSRDKYRFYPLTNLDGSVVADAYVVGIEEAKNNDYQDAVMIIRNVKKYIAPVEPPVQPPVEPPLDPGTGDEGWTDLI